MYGQEYAYVNPNKNQNPLDLFLKLKDYNDQQARYQQQVERQQREYQDRLLGQAADMLDYKQQATGTIYDPTILHTLNNGLQGISKMIMDNPDASAASVFMAASKIADDVSQYSNKIKTLRAGIEQASKELGKNPSIDGSRLFKLAMTKALTNADPQTGNVTMKDPSEIDDSKDWISEVLNNNPDQVVKGSGALDALLKNSDKKVYENEYTVDKGGVRRKIGYKGEYFPYNQLNLDTQGRPVLDNKGVPQVGIRSENLNGTPIATKEDAAYFTSDPGANAYLNSLVKQAGYDPNSEQGQNLKRYYLYQHLNQNNQGYINKTKDETDDSQLQSENFRRDMKSITESNKQSGTGNNSDVQTQNVYNEIEQLGKNKKYGIPLNELSTTSQGVLLDHAKRLLPSKDSAGNQLSYGMGDVYVAKDANGKYYLARTKERGKMPTTLAKEDIISPLDPKSVNTLRGVNSTLKERQSVLSQNNFTGVPKGGF